MDKVVSIESMNQSCPTRVIRLHQRDNVLVALQDLHKGEQVVNDGETYSLQSDVPAKHKFATKDLAPGDDVIMYGVLVGKVRQPIARGSVITTRNLGHDSSPFQEKTRDYHWRAPDVSRWRDATFQGYGRDDGQVGTRNYWLIVPLVFCENRNIEVLQRAFHEELGFASSTTYRQQVADLVRLYREGKSQEIGKPDPSPQREGARARVFPNVDGVKFLTHQLGCGGTREDTLGLCGLIAGYIHHPNVAGATILSLGCQHAQITTLREQIAVRNPKFCKPLHFFEQQKSGTEFAMLSEAIRATFQGLVGANELRRTPAPLSKLRVGLKCGGSDGFSGISANPALGHFSDLLAALGGSTILSEFPELCGVEQELIDRCVDKETGNRFIELVRAYAARAKAVGSSFEFNPSPGNIRDGLITDAMKSAGAAKKGGTSPVAAVLDYPEYAARAGLHLQCTPGSDVECVSAQVGAGANLVLFTTGLGTPTGNPIAPVVKLSTNSRLAEHMPDIIDVNTGEIITGQKTIEKMGEEILEFLAQVASGEVHTKAESLNQDDFIPWKRGVSL